MKANPNDAPALAEYGRVLIDLGRWEEAVEKLQAALKLDPNLPAVRYDLGYALLRMQGTEAAKENFEAALAEAEKQVGLGEGQQKSKDFFAWHRLGVLLYRKASQQKAASDPAAADTLKRSQDMMIEALKCGRKGADVSYGYYDYTLGYTSPKVIAISGFAYPEANEDYLILDSLRTLEAQPGDYLSYFNLATALYGLGQSDLAKEALDKSTALRSDYLESKYVAALIDKQNGDNEEAIALLTELLKVNPRHPHANAVLAELYAAEGNMDAAAAALAAQAKYYY